MLQEFICNTLDGGGWGSEFSNNDKGKMESIIKILPQEQLLEVENKKIGRETYLFPSLP